MSERPTLEVSTLRICGTLSSGSTTSFHQGRVSQIIERIVFMRAFVYIHGSNYQQATEPAPLHSLTGNLFSGMKILFPSIGYVRTFGVAAKKSG